MLKRILTFTAGYAILCAPSIAAERGVAVTVYNNDLGLVRDARAMDVPKGRGELRFTDVAAQIDPTSVHIRSLAAGGVAVLEQNFEYDLVSADKLLSKYVDQTVQVYAKEGKYFEGKLLSASGDLVLEKKDGSVQTLSRGMVQNVDFPKLPAGLITRPTLVWLLDSPKGGAQDLEVSYLTQGLSWHAEYVAVADKDDTTLDLAAWVSVDNRSGATYEDAKLKLIAGDVHRAEEPMVLPKGGRVMMAMEADSADQFDEKSFFEYHLYTLSRPSTLKNNQIKQIALFDPAKVSIRKIYQYDGASDPKKVKVTLEFQNAKAEGLGMPLPAGKVRIYKRDSDQSQEFIGEDRLDHTARDEKVRLNVGSAFDVVGERKQKDVRNLGSNARQETWEIKLRNHKDSDVEVVVVEHLQPEWDIVKKNMNFEKKDASTVEFKAPVKKNGEAVVEYTVITRW